MSLIDRVARKLGYVKSGAHPIARGTLSTYTPDGWRVLSGNVSQPHYVLDAHLRDGTHVHGDLEIVYP